MTRTEISNKLIGNRKIHIPSKSAVSSGCIKVCWDPYKKKKKKGEKLQLLVDKNTAFSSRILGDESSIPEKLNVMI